MLQELIKCCIKFRETLQISVFFFQVYAKTKDDIETYFQQKGITIVTIQPEFSIAAVTTPTKITDSQCLVECQSTDCIDKICCSPTINVPAHSQIDISKSTGHITSKSHSSSVDLRRRSGISSNPAAEKAKSMLSLDVSMLSTLGVVEEKCTSMPDVIHRVDSANEQMKETQIKVISAAEDLRDTNGSRADCEGQTTASSMEQPTAAPVQTNKTNDSNTAVIQNKTTPLQTEDWSPS